MNLLRYQVEYRLLCGPPGCPWGTWSARSLPCKESLLGPEPSRGEAGPRATTAGSFCQKTCRRAGAVVATNAGYRNPDKLAVITDNCRYNYWQYWIPLVSDIAFGLSPSAKAGLRLAAKNRNPACKNDMQKSKLFSELRTQSISFSFRRRRSSGPARRSFSPSWSRPVRCSVGAS